MIRMTLWKYTTLADPAPGGSRTPNFRSVAIRRWTLFETRG
jgi:hypothetical protein